MNTIFLKRILVLAILGSFDACAFSAKKDSILLAQHSPQTFGKTHFILGFDGNQKIAKVAKKISVTPSIFSVTECEPVKALLFSPDDNIRQALQYLIKNEQQKIKVAVFVFTDGEIAKELLEAKKRGVEIEVVTDPACLKDKYNKVTQLCNVGCPIFVYDPSGAKGSLSSCMHHKFAVFEQNAYNKTIVWTGSYNFTKSASMSNQENALIFDDRYLVERFKEQFERLKLRSFRYSPVART